MGRSLIVELQPWTTLNLDNDDVLVQSREGRVEAAWADTVMLWVDVRSLSACTLEVQTAIEDEEIAYVTMTSCSFTAARQEYEQVPPTADDPFIAWLRWKLTGAATGTPSITFRLLAKLSGA
jgi:hypothetical protein